MNAQPTAMVIDDSRIALETAAWLLESAGFRVLVRSTPIGATAELIRERVTAVVLDINMPVMSGSRFAKVLRNNQLLKDVALVLMTAHSDEELDRVAAQVNADGRVSKSRLEAQLVAVVRAAMAKRSVGLRSPDQTLMDTAEARPYALEAQGLSVAIEDGRTLVIGRGPKCDVLVDHSDTSRRHAAVTLEAGEVKVHDLESLNGTTVNGDAVPPAGRVLYPGDRLAVPGLAFVLVLADEKPLRIRETARRLHPQPRQGRSKD